MVSPHFSADCANELDVNDRSRILAAILGSLKDLWRARPIDHPRAYTRGADVSRFTTLRKRTGRQRSKSHSGRNLGVAKGPMEGSANRPSEGVHEGSRCLAFHDPAQTNWTSTIEVAFWPQSWGR